MQKRSLLLLFVLFVLLVPASSTVAQAKPFLKSVTTEIFDGPFPQDDPETRVYGRGVIHQTMIIKSVNWAEGTLDVTIQMSWEIRLYERIPTAEGFEVGDFLFLLKTTRIYEGTLIPDIPGGGMVTGTLVEDWVINEVAHHLVSFPPDMDLHGHWVTLYKDGTVVKRIGFGESPFQ